MFQLRPVVEKERNMLRRAQHERILLHHLNPIPFVLSLSKDSDWFFNSLSDLEPIEL